jgi:hypothetical protein
MDVIYEQPLRDKDSIGLLKICGDNIHESLNNIRKVLPDKFSNSCPVDFYLKISFVIYIM